MVADRVALRVTPPQHRRLLRWAECARLTYNWALSEWLRQHADHREALAALSDAASAPPEPFRNGLVHLFTVLREAGRLPSWAQEPLALTGAAAGCFLFSVLDLTEQTWCRASSVATSCARCSPPSA